MKKKAFPELIADSELGTVKRCSSCGECWPADGEFFGKMVSAADGLTPRCRACIKERLWAKVLRYTTVPSFGRQKGLSEDNSRAAHLEM